MVKMPFQRKEEEIVDIEKLINKGAPVKEDVKEDEKKWTNINVRFPTSLLKEIDDEVEKMVGISRTGWILQTIQKELRAGKDEA